MPDEYKLCQMSTTQLHIVSHMHADCMLQANMHAHAGSAVGQKNTEVI